MMKLFVWLCLTVVYVRAQVIYVNQRLSSDDTSNTCTSAGDACLSWEDTTPGSGNSGFGKLDYSAAAVGLVIGENTTLSMTYASAPTDYAIDVAGSPTTTTTFLIQGGGPDSVFNYEPTGFSGIPAVSQSQDGLCDWTISDFTWILQWNSGNFGYAALFSAIGTAAGESATLTNVIFGRTFTTSWTLIDFEGDATANAVLFEANSCQSDTVWVQGTGIFFNLLYIDDIEVKDFTMKNSTVMDLFAIQNIVAANYTNIWLTDTQLGNLIYSISTTTLTMKNIYIDDTSGFDNDIAVTKLGAGSTPSSASFAFYIDTSTDVDISYIECDNCYANCGGNAGCAIFRFDTVTTGSLSYMNITGTSGAFAWTDTRLLRSTDANGDISVSYIAVSNLNIDVDLSFFFLDDTSTFDLSFASFDNVVVGAMFDFLNVASTLIDVSLTQVYGSYCNFELGIFESQLDGLCNSVALDNVYLLYSNFTATGSIPFDIGTCAGSGFSATTIGLLVNNLDTSAMQFDGSTAVSIINSQFQYNVGPGTGTGFIIINGASDVTITNCTFTSNSGYLATIYFGANANASVAIDNCEFSLNPNDNTGLVYNVIRIGQDSNSTVMISNSLFDGNTAPTEGWIDEDTNADGHFVDGGGNRVSTTAPTSNPSSNPTSNPTSNPSSNPTNNPTTNPSANPSSNPTTDPSSNPTNNPTANPSNNPSVEPTIQPSGGPTSNPSSNPSSNPTSNPSNNPTSNPTGNPSSDPSSNPTSNPSNNPTFNPTVDPTSDPTSNPTSDPSAMPTSDPTAATGDDDDDDEPSTTDSGDDDDDDDDDDEASIGGRLQLSIVSIFAVLFAVLK